MLKGRKGAIASLALLGLSVFLCASPAVAQLAVSEPAVDTDDLAPSPVGEVHAEFNEGGRSITVSWTLSGDDVMRQSPSSSDFTSGGTFTNVNEVAGYNVWRRSSSSMEGEAPEGSLAIVGTASAGAMSLVDASVSLDGRYIYMVSVVDANGNESISTESDEVKNTLLLGDFDYDGDVDLDDYGIFQANFGRADFDPATDIDGNGVVDLTDFFLWADNLGVSL